MCLPQTLDFVMPSGRDFQKSSTSFQILLMARQFSERRVEIPTNPFLAPAGFTPPPLPSRHFFISPEKIVCALCGTTQVFS
jgi:hypothetical protein